MAGASAREATAPGQRPALLVGGFCRAFSAVSYPSSFVMTATFTAGAVSRIGNAQTFLAAFLLDSAGRRIAGADAEVPVSSNQTVTVGLFGDQVEPNRAYSLVIAGRIKGYATQASAPYAEIIGTVTNVQRHILAGGAGLRATKGAPLGVEAEMEKLLAALPEAPGIITPFLGDGRRVTTPIEDNGPVR